MYELFTIATIIFWELGGQFEKSIRRYGIPFAMLLLIIWRCQNGGIWWHYIPLVGVAPELFVGYGTGSFAAKIFKEDWKIRIAYALMLAFPITITSLINGHYMSILLGVSSLIIAFQVRAGSLFTIKKKSFLFEDFIRSLAVASFICSSVR